ncbi:MAG TPA: O-antigen ligase family protein [Solirubrobacterales bacterium]|nr:O-antigen ligase family protein [Solirubrobacterales bacterium]
MSELLAGAGVLLVAAACAGAILLPPGRLRGVVMVLAMVLFPVLIAGDQWHTAQIVDLRHDEVRIVALLAIAAVVIALLTYLFRRWPILLPLAIIFALPFRVPLEAGGDTANLLVPLYLVIAAAVLATLLRDWSDPPSAHPPRALAWVLAAVVALYGLQTLYSEDFSQGLQNLCFFLVPFTIAYRLLREVEWDRRLLRWALVVVAAEAVVFVLIGSAEWLTRELFWNDQVIRSNEFHTYFRVNSIFWDPNVYGRYLALVTVVATAALLWARTRETFWLLTGLIVVLWIGLVPTYSQSSFIALLAGLAVLAAVRWGKPRWTLAAVAVGCVGVAAVVLLAGGRVDVDRINIITGGRANLVEGGAELFSERPLWGSGSGSFQEAYKDHREDKDVPVSESHTEPITVAAEQGLIGLLLYLSLIVIALWTLGRGLWTSPPAGGDDREDSPGRESPRSETGPAGLAARAAILAAFVALLVHTLSYAGFFDDPITWVLLAIGASLAHAAAPTIRDPA